MSRPPHLPGEYDVAHLPDIVHLDSIERVTGVAAAGSGSGSNGATTAAGGGGAATTAATETAGSTAADSALHASTSEQASSAFWKGSLYLTNYQLTFVVSEGAHAGHYALGFSSAPQTNEDAQQQQSHSSNGHSAGAHHFDPGALSMAPLHPNADSANLPLLHVPVGSIFKLEKADYSAASHQHVNAASAPSHGGASASAAAIAANSTLRDVEIQLTITCRDARVLNFGILRAGEKRANATGTALLETNDERNYCVTEFYRLLKKHAFPKETRKLFAFSFMSAGKGGATGGDAPKPQLSDVDGWTCYNIEREFARMGVGVHPADAARGLSLVHPRRKAAWRMDAHSNARFELSPTYPQAFWLPMALSDKELAKVVKFRSKGRLPALVYSYSDLLDYQALGLSVQHYPDTVILRAAQPNVGWTFGRCAADERLLELAHVRVIIDARPFANAVANQAKGGGYENAEHYKQCRIEFMNIENIHVMRTSLEKLLDLLRHNHLNPYNTGSTGSGDEFWGAVQQSGWLKHVRILLEGAVVCANYIKNGTSILVHCSDGWDRTSQLTSLAQIILDPFYRTRAGFAVLVEKEWLSFGHQFHKRCGHGHKDTSEGTERSPIFYQFLDAVWQIMQQHPAAFEFNADFLAACADHLYSGKYGTFLHDNERQRALDHVRQNTHSLWSDLCSARRGEGFRNVLYGGGGPAMPGASAANPSMNLGNLAGAELGRAAFLHISADPRRISIWPYWYRWERRKQSAAPHMHVLHRAASLGSLAAGAADATSSVVVPTHLHHTPVGQVMSFTLSQLALERAKQDQLHQALAAMEADAARLDAAMRALTIEANQARQARGEAPLPVPTSFRQVQAAQLIAMMPARAAPPPPPPPQSKSHNHTNAAAVASSSSSSSSAAALPPAAARWAGLGDAPSTSHVPVETSNPRPYPTFVNPARRSGGPGGAMAAVTGLNQTAAKAGAGSAPPSAATVAAAAGPAATDRGSVWTESGSKARGSIMTFGSNPLLGELEEGDEHNSAEDEAELDAAQLGTPPPPPAGVQPVAAASSATSASASATTANGSASVAKGTAPAVTLTNTATAASPVGGMRVFPPTPRSAAAAAGGTSSAVNNNTSTVPTQSFPSGPAPITPASSSTVSAATPAAAAVTTPPSMPIPPVNPSKPPPGRRVNPQPSSTTETPPMHPGAPPMPPGAPPVPPGAPPVPAGSPPTTPPGSASTSAAAADCSAAAPAPVSMLGAAGGPPQFRMSAAAFSGVKLKSTLQRFDQHAAQSGAVSSPSAAPANTSNGTAQSAGWNGQAAKPASAAASNPAIAPAKVGSAPPPTSSLLSVMGDDEEPETLVVAPAAAAAVSVRVPLPGMQAQQQQQQQQLKPQPVQHPGPPPVPPPTR